MDSALCAHEIFWPAVRLEGPSGTTQEAAKIVEESFARGRQAYLPRQGTAFEPEWLRIGMENGWIVFIRTLFIQ